MTSKPILGKDEGLGICEDCGRAYAIGGRMGKGWLCEACANEYLRKYG